MIEAALGADAVTVHESNEFIERMENGDKYMTNSCCPGFLSFIEKTVSTEAGKISGTVSPMVATAKYIKAQDPEAKIVFIGPCTAKKAEVKNEYVSQFVDNCMTFEELQAFIDASNINVSELEETTYGDFGGSSFGRGFAKCIP